MSTELQKEGSPTSYDTWFQGIVCIITGLKHIAWHSQTLHNGHLEQDTVAQWHEIVAITLRNTYACMWPGALIGLPRKQHDHPVDCTPSRILVSLQHGLTPLTKACLWSTSDSKGSWTPPCVKNPSKVWNWRVAKARIVQKFLFHNNFGVWPLI